MQTISFNEVRRQFASQGVEFTRALQARYGDRMKMRVPFLPPVYYLFHPDDVHETLVARAGIMNKPPFLTNVLKSSFGQGLFTSHGELWKRQRKAMQPTFHHGKLDRFAARMVEKTQTHTASWTNGTQTEIDKEMHALTFKVVMDALFNDDASEKTAPVYAAMKALGEGIAAQGASLALALLPEWLPLPAMRRKREGVATLDRMIGAMIDERERLGEAASPPDLLTLLMFTTDPDTGERMPRGQVRDELVTLFIAGHETTAVLLGWVWSLLAQHPEVETALHAELQTVLSGRAPTLADLPRLTLTGQIIKETLRLYPPAWFIMRQANEAATIGGEAIAKNGILFLLPYANQRDARWFDQPDAFIPGRWVEGYERGLPKGAYLPFGMGPRICIGNGFAMMEAQLLVATIAQKYRFEFQAVPEPVGATTTLGFKQPVPVKIRVR